MAAFYKRNTINMFLVEMFCTNERWPEKHKDLLDRCLEMKNSKGKHGKVHYKK